MKFKHRHAFMAPKEELDGAGGGATIDLDDLVKDGGKSDDLKAKDKTEKEVEDRGDELADEGQSDKKAPKKKVAKEEAEETEEEEAEEETEETEEEEAEEEEPAAKAKDPNKMVPIQRVDQLKAKRDKYKADYNAANERADALQAKLDAALADKNTSVASKEFADQVDALYVAVATASAEGDIAGAAKAMKQLDELKDRVSTAKAQYISGMAAVKAQETTAYNAMVDQIELLVPELNPKDEDNFDEDMLEDVAALTQVYENRGMKPAEALKRAVQSKFGKEVLNPKAKDLKELAEKKVEPKKTDLKKNIDALKKTPPDSQRGAGKEKSEVLDPALLSDEEYKALPMSKKKELRGDFFTG